MTKLTRLSVEGLELSQKEKDRCRNFFAMGLVFWLYDRPLEPTLRYIEDKFGKKPEIAGANTAGAVQLLDDRFRRRRIGLLSGASADTARTTSWVSPRASGGSTSDRGSTRTVVVPGGAIWAQPTRSSAPRTRTPASLMWEL